MPAPTRPRRPSPWLALGAAACLAAAGCGGGEGRSRISGKVTFRGAPVPAGKIYFIPNSAKGATGAAGFADIRGGVYDTALEGGKGAISGSMVVAIEGVEPVSGAPSGDVTAKSLFPRYEMTLEVSGPTTKDFDVPASAAAPANAAANPKGVVP